MNEITILEPDKLTSVKNIVEYASKLQEFKKGFEAFEKTFREKVKEYMDREELARISGDKVEIVKVKQERYTYNPETVEFVLGDEFIKKSVDMPKLNKAMRNMEAEQFGAINETAKVKKTEFITIKSNE